MNLTNLMEFEKEDGYPAFDIDLVEIPDCNCLAYIFHGGDCEIEVVGNIYENPELMNHFHIGNSHGGEQDDD